jgi:hypothetical protein
MNTATFFFTTFLHAAHVNKQLHHDKRENETEAVGG